MEIRSKITTLINAIDIHHKNSLNDTEEGKNQKEQALKIINNVSSVLFTNIIMFMKKKHTMKYSQLASNNPQQYYNLLASNSFDRDIQLEAIDIFTTQCIKNPNLLNPGYTMQMFVKQHQ